MEREYVEEKDKSYQAVFRSQYLACTIVDQNGMVKKITRAMLERFALSAMELKTRSLWDCLHSKVLQEFIASHMEENKECSNRLVAIYGTRNMILWNKVEITTMNLSENRKDYLIVFCDCTESYQAQMILESNLALSSEMFLFFDLSECVLQCSEEAVRIFGFPNRFEAYGMHYTTFFHDRIASQLIRELFQVIGEGKRYERNIPIKYKGVYEVYEVQAFNVMVKSVKTGTAICFHRKHVEEPLYCMEEQVPYEQEVQSVFELGDGERLIEYEKRPYAELLKDLQRMLNSYEYTDSVKLISYLLTEASEKECIILKQVERELMGFHYENAVKLLEGYF